MLYVHVYTRYMNKGTIIHIVLEPSLKNAESVKSTMH